MLPTRLVDSPNSRAAPSAARRSQPYRSRSAARLPLPRRVRSSLPRRVRSSGWSPRLSRRPHTVSGRSPGRIHALMPTGTAGDRRCVRCLRDRLLSSVLNHTPGPLLSATQRRTMTLNCRPPGHEERALDDDDVCPACLLTVIHTPPNPYTLDGWLPMRPGWWGDDGWRNPTDLPHRRRTRAAAEPAAGGQTERTAT
jgi:hypothetical protein